MIHPVTSVTGSGIRALDGSIGTVKTFLFDDEAWTIRYLVVDTGGWLPGRQVLVSPRSLGRFDVTAGELAVQLPRERIEHAPDIETDRPVSRQREVEFNAYYSFPPYWGGPFLWGAQAYPPLGVTPEISEAAHEAAERIQASSDAHLRSIAEVTGYAVHATDGTIGHVEDFLVADDTWTIRYLEVDTRDWWPGRKVVIPPRWVNEVSWADRMVSVPVDRETVRRAPEYDGSAPLASDLETQLDRHYAARDVRPGSP